MSHTPSTAERLAFFGMTDESKDIRHAYGPSQFHCVHGVFPKGQGQETRVTTTVRGPYEKSARLHIRTWRADANGVWWPLKNDHGCSIQAEHAETFGRAIAAAVATLASEAKS